VDGEQKELQTGFNVQLSVCNWSQKAYTTKRLVELNRREPVNKLSIPGYRPTKLAHY